MQFSVESISPIKKSPIVPPLSDSNIDFVVSAGIAGPGGGTPEKPVGLVYMGCCVNGKTIVREYQFRGSRAKIREQAVVKALTLLRSCILDAE